MLKLGKSEDLKMVGRRIDEGKKIENISKTIKVLGLAWEYFPASGHQNKLFLEGSRPK